MQSSRFPYCESAIALLVCILALGSAEAGAAQPPDTQSVAALIDTLELRAAHTPVREMPGWQTPRRVVVFLEGQSNDADNQGFLARLASIAPKAELVPVFSFEEAIARVGDADVFLGYCTPAILSAGTKLRYILSYSAGVDRCVGVEGLAQRNLLITNMQRIYGPAIAEHVMAMMLSLAHGLPVYRDQQMQRQWTPVPAGMQTMEISGRTLLVAGLGGIGTEIARRAHALGMHVIATRNSSHEGPDFVDYVGLGDELPALAAKADVIVNAMPLTPSTTAVFDAAFFNGLRPGAYFINIGRGASVVTADLIAALRENRLAAAALDVTDPEPLPADNALWAMPNVIITPHVSALSGLSEARFRLLVQENFRRYVNGERMLNVVDIAKGY